MNPSTNQFGNRVRVVRVETVVKLGKTLVNGGLVGKGLAIGEHLIFELDDG